MKSPENSTSSLQETEKEVAIKSPEVATVENVEVSNEQVQEYATKTEQQIEEQSMGVLLGSDQKIETSAKSMDVSSETMETVKQEQGLDNQLSEIQAEASLLANEAKLEISTIATEVMVAPEEPTLTKNEIPNNAETANEPDLEAFAKAQDEKARGVIDQISSMSGEDAATFVAEYNKNNPDSLKGQELRLMRSEGDTMFIVNERGSLEKVAVNKENAREMLAQFKAQDEVLKGKSYELRKAILERSEGGIITHEAYTYGEVPQGNALDSFLDNPENWVAERRALHEQIINEEYGKAAALSERLDDPEPTIYALRGNTAAGKTTAVRNNEIFSKALDAKGQPSGAINPDTYKGQLKSTEVVEGRQTVGHQQTHEEGSMIARKVSEKITKSESSMVIDKRMNKEKNITELIKTAEESGKKLKILDVDVPFEVSLVRVLGREIGGEDPLVPFGAVAEGFEGVRKNRASLLEQVANDPKIKDYVLMVADEKGNSVKVAEKIDGKLVIIEGREEAFQRAVDKGTESSVTEMSQTVIDDAYVAKIMDRTPEVMQSKVRASLDRYKGKTLKEALDEHSSKLNPE